MIMRELRGGRGPRGGFRGRGGYRGGFERGFRGFGYRGTRGNDFQFRGNRGGFRGKEVKRGMNEQGENQLEEKRGTDERKDIKERLGKRRDEYSPMKVIENPRKGLGNKALRLAFQDPEDQDRIDEDVSDAEREAREEDFQ